MVELLNFLMVKLLNCWFVELLKCWIIELLNCWIVKLLNYEIKEIIVININIRGRWLKKPLGHLVFFSAICWPKWMMIFFLEGKWVQKLSCKILANLDISWEISFSKGNPIYCWKWAKFALFCFDFLENIMENYTKIVTVFLAVK